MEKFDMIISGVIFIRRWL